MVPVILLVVMVLADSTGVSGVEDSQRDFSIVQNIDGQCLSPEEKQQAMDSLLQNVDDVIVQQYSGLFSNPLQQEALTESLICDGTPGWRQVAFINMTNPSYECPPGLTIAAHRNLITRRTCGRSSLSTPCASTTFSVGGSTYSKVCGRIIGYQYGDTDAFYMFLNIEQNYVSGVSLTHGAPGSRQHIWTFAAGITQNSEDHHRTSTYPCDIERPGNAISPQTFIGDDYMCESSPTSQGHAGDHIFYADNKLWDGQGCKAASTCCEFNTPPWFTKTLPSSTTDDIEMRLCASVSATAGEDTPLELIELYVK